MDELTQEFETVTNTVYVLVALDGRDCLLDKEFELARVVETVEAQIEEFCQNFPVTDLDFLVVDKVSHVHLKQVLNEN